MPPPLNPAQRDAVEHFLGPVLVLAGAGSGKTRVITHRIARLIERGIPPTQIVALTFTNKAAAEMGERVGHVMKERGAARGAEGLVVSTFHSFGLQVLSREARARRETFTIFDQGDQLALIKELLASRRGGRAYDASAILARISSAKNSFLTPEAMKTQSFSGRASSEEDEDTDPYDHITREIYPRYQAALRNFHAFDFDDLVCEIAHVWTAKPDVLAKYKERHRFLLVDEYQDTNGAQLEVLRLLASDHKNICVVGDDDQSIYAWRGADVRNILMFDDHFPGATIIKLEQNYRSRKPILDVANAVISKRTDAKHKKTLFTDKTGGEIARLVTAPSPEAEATYVGKRIFELVRIDKVKPREIAVLYRSNSQAKLIEECLREHGVAYRVVGGQQFFERKEVKDLLSYLKCTLNRADEISLRRILNYPARGIGETSVERLSQAALAKGWSLWQAIERVDSLDGIPNAAREGCKNLETVIAETRRRLMVAREPASGVARDLCERVGLRTELDAQSGSPSIAARRWQNVEGIFSTLQKREAREVAKGKDATSERELQNFLHALTLNFGEEGEDPKEVVTLSTLHGSKGLEFEHVFLLGCEEGFMPHSRTTDMKATDIALPGGVDNIEEERRLFYVGVTRAREVLTMMRCTHRVMRGKPMARTPSRFLSDIPAELLVLSEATEQKQTMNDMASGSDGLLAALLGSS